MFRIRPLGSQINRQISLNFSTISGPTTATNKHPKCDFQSIIKLISSAGRGVRICGASEEQLATERKRLNVLLRGVLTPYETYYFLKKNFNITVDKSMIVNRKLNIDLSKLGIDFQEFVDKIPKCFPVTRINTSEDAQRALTLLASDEQHNFTEESIERMLLKVSTLISNNGTFQLALGASGGCDRIVTILNSYIDSHSPSSVHIVRRCLHIISSLSGAPSFGPDYEMWDDDGDTMFASIKEIVRNNNNIKDSKSTSSDTHIEKDDWEHTSESETATALNSSNKSPFSDYEDYEDIIETGFQIPFPTHYIDNLQDIQISHAYNHEAFELNHCLEVVFSILQNPIYSTDPDLIDAACTVVSTLATESNTSQLRTLMGLVNQFMSPTSRDFNHIVVVSLLYAAQAVSDPILFANDAYLRRDFVSLLCNILDWHNDWGTEVGNVSQKALSFVVDHIGQENADSYDINDEDDEFQEFFTRPSGEKKNTEASIRNTEKSTADSAATAVMTPRIEPCGLFQHFTWLLHYCDNRLRPTKALLNVLGNACAQSQENAQLCRKFGILSLLLEMYRFHEDSDASHDKQMAAAILNCLTKVSLKSRNNRDLVTRVVGFDPTADSRRRRLESSGRRREK